MIPSEVLRVMSGKAPSGSSTVKRNKSRHKRATKGRETTQVPASVTIYK